MKTVAITHCYTDKNKGDAAIIQSTIQLLRKRNKDLDIHLYSVFGSSDIRFKSEHEFIKPFANKLYPALLCTPEKLKWLPYEFSRGLSFIIAFFQSLLLLVSSHPYWVKCIARGKHAEGIIAMSQADLVISKGGSYLTSQNTSIRQAISLFTMLYPFLFALRYKRQCIIFSQSLGPISGSLNKFLFRHILRKIDKIYLREKLCIDEYDIVRDLVGYTDIEVIPDTAFYFEKPEPEWTGSASYLTTVNLFDDSRIKIGITIVDHAFKYIGDKADRERLHSKYVNSLVATLRHLIKNYDAQIHIFPQVIVSNSHEGHNDARLSRSISDVLNAEGSNDVFFHDYDFAPIELRLLYGQMDAFIGTRLHSVIFASSMGCPAINISYHGTKSQGIFADIASLSDNVIKIDTITEKDLIEKIDRVIADHHQVRSKIMRDMKSMQDRLISATDNALKNLKE